MSDFAWQAGGNMGLSSDDGISKSNITGTTYSGNLNYGLQMPNMISMVFIGIITIASISILKGIKGK